MNGWMDMDIPIEVPFVGCAELAEVALDHGHGVVLDVLRVARLDVGDVVALDAAEELLLQMSHALVTLQGHAGTGRELARRAFQIFFNETKNKKIDKFNSTYIDSLMSTSKMSRIFRHPEESL